MAAGKSVADILSGAKDTLRHADEFEKSAGGPLASTPKHEYSNASYAMVKPKAKSSTSLVDDAADAAAGIKAKGENIARYKKAQ